MLWDGVDDMMGLDDGLGKLGIHHICWVKSVMLSNQAKKCEAFRFKIVI